MIRITEALNRVACRAAEFREPPVVVKMPIGAILSLAIAIEDDLGARIYDSGVPQNGIKFHGIEFRPDNRPSTISGEWYV